MGEPRELTREVAEKARRLDLLDLTVRNLYTWATYGGYRDAFRLFVVRLYLSDYIGAPDPDPSGITDEERAFVEEYRRAEVERLREVATASKRLYETFTATIHLFPPRMGENEAYEQAERANADAFHAWEAALAALGLITVDSGKSFDEILAALDEPQT